MIFYALVSGLGSLFTRDPQQIRSHMIAARRDELKAQSSIGRNKRRQRRAKSEDLMTSVVTALRLVQTSQTQRLKEKLAKAGARSREAMITYFFFKFVSPFGAGLAGAAFVYAGGYDLSIMLRMSIPLGSAILGFYLPDLYVSNRATKRSKALELALPDGLDLLVICAEAGLSLDSALTRVANEMGNSSPELADELALTAVELTFLPDRKQALSQLGKRVDSPSMRGVVNTLIQTERYGTPLAQSLRVLSSEFREQRMLRAEEKAARLPATLTVPMIVFILPTLFVVLAGPAVIDVYDQMIK
ncbi:MAG: type II secretion system F family protein [Pseudomonadota bacterium]